MNIAHLLSQNHLTGAEVYAATLACEQIRLQHRVYQISNGFFYPSEAVKISIEVETKSKWQQLKNIFWLRNYIAKENIHVLHSHSRAAVKLAYWATLFTRTAHISSVHGIQHSSISKKIHDQYGEFIVCVCENIKKHLMNDYSYSERRLRVIANPIDTNLYKFVDLVSIKSQKSPLKIAIIGRTTGPKAERTRQVIQCLRENRFKKLNFHIFLIGGNARDLNLADAEIKDLTEVQVSELNSGVYADYDLVIGSGRVCLEALISGTPCIAFGEALYCGLITEQNFAQASASNFGDITPVLQNPQIDADRFADDVFTLTEKRTDLKSLSVLAEKLFSLKIVAASIMRLYESAYFLKNHPHWIPVLMYHKVPDDKIDSQHKIFVTKNNFEKHLKFFKRMGFKTLTFSDLKAFKSLQKSFKDFPRKPLILSFDDGYRDNLENASPLLKKYDYRAQLFLLADPAIGSNQWDSSSSEPAHEIISGAERQKWKNSAFEIGSHGFAHEKLTALDSENAFKELADSKKSLEKEFKRDVNVYAFTYGITTDKSRELAEAAGYDYAVNTDSGGRRIEEDPFAVFRVNIFPDENYWSLFKKTSRWYRSYYYFKRNK